MSFFSFSLSLLMVVSTAALAGQPAGSFSFAEAENYFSHGAVPQGQQLIGTWAQTALADNEYGYPTIIKYDASGLKDADGSTRAFVFAKQPSFDGGEGQDVVSEVRVRSDGHQTKDLVNSDIAVSPSKKGPSFVTASYDKYGDVDQSTHFRYHCLLLADNADRMVCSIIRSSLNDPDESDDIIAYWGLSRQLAK